MHADYTLSFNRPNKQHGEVAVTVDDHQRITALSSNIPDLLSPKECEEFKGKTLEFLKQALTEEFGATQIEQSEVTERVESVSRSVLDTRPTSEIIRARFAKIESEINKEPREDPDGHMRYNLYMLRNLRTLKADIEKEGPEKLEEYKDLLEAIDKHIMHSSLMLKMVA